MRLTNEVVGFKIDVKLMTVVRESVTIQRIVAGLGLSRSRVEFSACLEVSFLGGLESFCQVVPMAV